MPLKKLASSSAHRILSELIDLGLIPDADVTAVERSEEHGVQVVVIITKYDGPMQLHLSAEGYAKLGIKPPAPKPSLPAEPTPPLPAPLSPEPSPQLRIPPRWKKILDVLKGQPERKGEWIALKCRRSYGGGFRSDLSDLVRHQLLEKGAHGYRINPDKAA